jgi:hypothetical protein
MVVSLTADTSNDWSREVERGLHRAQDQRDGINSFAPSKRAALTMSGECGFEELGFKS